MIINPSDEHEAAAHVRVPAVGRYVQVAPLFVMRINCPVATPIIVDVLEPAQGAKKVSPAMFAATIFVAGTSESVQYGGVTKWP